MLPALYRVLCHVKMCKGEKDMVCPKGADSIAEMRGTYTKPCNNTRFAVTSHLIGLQSKCYGDTGEGSSFK